MRIIDILRTDVARAVEDRKKSSLGPFPNSITVPNEMSPRGVAAGFARPQCG